MERQGATAVGIANISMDGDVLDVWYPEPTLIDDPAGDVVPGTRRLGAHELTHGLLKLVLIDEDRMVEQVAVRTTIADLNSAPIDEYDVYLRLHLLSHRLVRPLEMNMDGALLLLHDVVWTNKGPVKPGNFEAVRANLRQRGLIHVYGIEKLPRMVDYVVPNDVIIAEAERVRLGAYLAPGTIVQREGYVSYNAGTLGPAKVEGRMSSATVIGEGSDLGASSTVMACHGKLGPRGHRDPMRLGDHCTLGVSAGVIGLELGDNCSLGPNVVLERTTDLWDADAEQHTTGGQIAGMSDISVRFEKNHPEPVVRRLSHGA